MMRDLIKIIKSIKIKQILTVFLASCLLLVSTACSKGNIAQTGGQTYTETAKRAMSDTYDDYDADQEFKGGMNGYNDDRRYDAETAAKAKTLVDTAKSRQKDDLGDYADSITDRAGNKIEEAKREIPNSLQSKKNETVQAVKEKSSKLQDNLEAVPGETKQVIDEATDTAQKAVEDATEATEKTAKDIKENFEDLS